MKRSTSTSLAVLLLAGAAQALAAPTYRIKVLDPPSHGWGSQASAISARGEVVGSAQQDNGGVAIATAWQPGGDVLTLGTLPGDLLSFALGVNSAGQVVGYSGFDNSPRAWVWNAAQGMQYLGAFDEGNPNSSALAISEDGLVVGHSVTSTGTLHAFTWTAATGLVDATPDAYGSEALAIDRHDQWVGGILSHHGESGVRVNAGGKPTLLGELSAAQPYTYGNAVNDLGNVAGSSVAADGNYHAFTWDKLHGVQDLGFLPGSTGSSAFGISEAGQVVGNSTGNGSVPFYYDERVGMKPLASMIAADDPLKGQVELDSAMAINRRGVIVVNGQVTIPGSSSPRPRALLLIPE